MKKRILKNSSVKNISRFVSIKNDSIETVESDLEFDACFHFEFNPHLVYFEAQPIGYKYLLNKKLHRYTPDFLCRFSDGYERYYEIKYKDEVDTEEFKEKFEVQRLQAISMGRDLQVLTEKDIQVYPLLENLEIIHRYACMDKPDAIQTHILKLFRSYSELRICQIVANSNQDSAFILPAIYDLVAKKLLQFDWHQPLNWDTPLWRVA